MNDGIIKANEKVEAWTRGKRETILKILPFNPMVVKRAFDELLEDSEVGSWKYVAELLDKDAGLSAQLIQEANVLLVKRNREREINSLIDAISICGNRRTREILEIAISKQICDKMKELPHAELQLMWKRSWATAFACRQVADLYGEKGDKAFVCGILSTLGRLVMIQLYRSDYLTAIELGLQEPYEIRGAERSELENRKFGVDNGEVACWMLTQFGFHHDYAEAALLHQREPGKDLRNKWPLITSFAHQIAGYLLMDDRYKHLFQGRENLPDLNKFSHDKNEFFFQLRQRLKSEFGLELGKAREFLESIEAALKDYQINVSGSLKIINENEFLKALNEIDERRKDLLSSVFMNMDRQIAEGLPTGIAGDFIKLSEARKEDLSEVPVLLNRIMSGFLLIVNNTVLALSYRYLGVKLTLDTVVKYMDGNSIFEVSLLKEAGLTLSFEHILLLRGKEELKAHKLLNFMIDEKPELLAVLRGSGNFLSNLSKDINQLTEKLYHLLKKFSLLNMHFWIETDMDYLYAEKQYMVHSIPWQGPGELKDRAPSVFKGQQPQPKSFQGLYLSAAKKKIFLPAFMVYRNCANCNINHVFIVDGMNIYKKDGINALGLNLRPMSAESECPDIRDNLFYN